MTTMSGALPEFVEKCPTCGRFVSHEDGYGDVEPTGCRGYDYLAVYCDRACADKMYETHHERVAVADCICDE